MPVDLLIKSRECLDVLSIICWIERFNTWRSLCRNVADFTADWRIGFSVYREVVLFLCWIMAWWRYIIGRFQSLVFCGMMVWCSGCHTFSWDLCPLFCRVIWQCGSVAELDLWSTGRRFKSLPPHYRVQLSASCLDTLSHTPAADRVVWFHRPPSQD